MKIDIAVVERYAITDVDTRELLAAFDEQPGSCVLEVGAHDEPVANILTDCGYRVVGVDLREYNSNQDTSNKEAGPPCNYTYLRHDFCDLPSRFLVARLQSFDVAIALSAIEHFGLGTYNEGETVQPYYDVIAMRTIWQLLKDGGVCYLTVPFGAKHKDVIPHWRVYDRYSIAARLVQDFTVEHAHCFVAGPFTHKGRVCTEKDTITWEDACNYDGDDPHISALLKLRKRPCRRLAPDGR